MTYIELLRAGCVGLSLLAGSAFAAVTPEQASQLGNQLTPLGAQKSGNADGTIPPWTGGLPTTTAGVDKDGFLPNPYAAEKPLFIISSKNATEYQDKLTPGQLTLLKRYPDSYRIPVYTTHRSVNAPDKILAAVHQNATSTELVEGGNGLENYHLAGVPFPIPKDGLEVIWNHIARYRGDSLKRTVVQASPQTNGNFTPSLIKQELAYPIGMSDYQPDEMSNILSYYREEILSPSRLAGDVLLVHETINQVKEPRMAWLYNGGQRRVRRAPQVAYDSPAAEGMRTLDDFDLFNGAPDRFEWKLVGKKEIYIPYNSYSLESPKLKYDDIIQAGHINQDHTRYELHRVWHLTATLRPGQRHIYSRRDIFIDEDSWQAAEADAYDGRGELWRVSEGHAIFFYDYQVPLYAAETHYDVLSGRYSVNSLRNEEKNAYQFNLPVSRKEFTPSALRATGIR
ncbi:DUF1329 domain-containing protein [Pseudomonas graminis]|uniref:DUF1329 domain-containing protein n=1 Tax=Pseudomonas graminis TaxID=158627 RepID=UPI002349B307|nr:DUF1329 domain-containing protein [Pseudomonas graminis]MDC6378921.1 DUF1329 domain-containing protein [Pseudomonas graminis]